jgi:hypothetical protein
MAIRRKRKDSDANELPPADQQQEQNARDDQNARDEALDLRPCAGAADVPGQPEPSAEAEGAHEPELDEALARRLAQ